MRPRPSALFYVCGRTMFAPTMRFTIICRGRRPRRPVLAPEGPDGEKQKSVKNRAALLHGLAFLLLDLIFGVPRGEQPLGRAPRLGTSGTFLLLFWSQKSRHSGCHPLKRPCRKVGRADRLHIKRSGKPIHNRHGYIIFTLQRQLLCPVVGDDRYHVGIHAKPGAGNFQVVGHDHVHVFLVQLGGGVLD